MENRAHALMAGLFTLLMGAATILIIYAFSDRREETRALLVVTQQNVGGLNPQAQVRYRGIRVGKVQDIRLDPEDARNILIRIEVETDVPLSANTTARMAYQGITGIAHVLLEDGEEDEEGGARGARGQALTGNPPRIAMQPSFLNRLEDSLPELLAQTRNLLENANALLDEKNRGRLGQTLANLESSSQHMNATLANLQNLLAKENTQGLTEAMRAAAPLADETRQLVAHMERLTDRAEIVLSEESGGNGSEDALLPRVRNTAADLSKAAAQFDRVLKMLERSPQSLLLGAPNGTPGPGEEGFIAPIQESGEMQ
ncbi:ABC transporter substrate-binding protein [Betaproteobacteria bacterium]|nr:ABC transporter substrate-binding protein [Betaproteobacteria bacterium]GHU48252.1 ABC transporter substrate-binding protein [Betaproteobacteria bacterium]